MKQQTATNYRFADYDLKIIKLILQGVSQKDMPEKLKAAGISPTGLSSIEKRLKLIKRSLQMNTNSQLVVYCKDNGLI